MNTITAINAANTQKYVMVSNEFGFPMYVAPAKGGEIEVTDIKEEAESWTYADTLSSVKLAHHKVVTGYNGLTWEVK